MVCDRGRWGSARWRQCQAGACDVALYECVWGQPHGNTTRVRGRYAKATGHCVIGNPVVHCMILTSWAGGRKAMNEEKASPSDLAEAS